jgi:hypothetical protein
MARLYANDTRSIALLLEWRRAQSLGAAKVAYEYLSLGKRHWLIGLKVFHSGKTAVDVEALLN